MKNLVNQLLNQILLSNNLNKRAFCWAFAAIVYRRLCLFSAGKLSRERLNTVAVGTGLLLALRAVNGRSL
jgi:hypothetical protein